MSEPRPMVRFVPSPDNIVGAELSYCVQAFDFYDGSGWSNVGVVTVARDGVVGWRPFPAFSTDFSSLDAIAGEVIRREAKLEFAPYVRSRIRVLVEEIRSGKVANVDRVVPVNFEINGLPAEAPVFAIDPTANGSRE